MALQKVVRRWATAMAVAAVLTGLFTAPGCGNAGNEKRSAASGSSSQSEIREGDMAFVLTSSAFDEGGMIPGKYTCDGPDISPPLKWDSAPAGTKSLALITDDPDAPMGTWVHWVIFNIPPSVKELPESVPTKDSLPDGTLQGKNDFRKVGYGGPCPPGGTHRYFFKLYALDTKLTLKSGASKADLLKAMEGHILAQAQLMGKYSH